MSKLAVECRQICLLQVTVGTLYGCDTQQGQLVGQTSLVSVKSTLGPASRLWGVGSYHADAKMSHGPAELRRVAFVNLTPGFRGMPVVAAAIRVESAEQAMLLNGFFYPLKAAVGAFFITEKHGVVFVRGIVHGAYEIPFLIWYPLMGAAILMDHHAGKR